jgi:hypothetical protein
LIDTNNASVAREVPFLDEKDPVAMFRWPDRGILVLLAYGLVFVGLPVLCYLSYLWVRGDI